MQGMPGGTDSGSGFSCFRVVFILLVQGLRPTPDGW